ncbi:hypothetical protein LCGC14_2531510 [marine sediment metagenome]|uniref:Uncharacterized protein n=1 Tax=marine sediment metagenome TaxID=412755 RepID=A0A0F9BG94_9ZZZZ
MPNRLNIPRILRFARNAALFVGLSLFVGGVVWHGRAELGDRSVQGGDDAAQGVDALVLFR